MIMSHIHIYMHVDIQSCVCTCITVHTIINCHCSKFSNLKPKLSLQAIQILSCSFGGKKMVYFFHFPIINDMYFILPTQSGVMKCSITSGYCEYIQSATSGCIIHITSMNCVDLFYGCTHTAH